MVPRSCTQIGTLIGLATAYKLRGNAQQRVPCSAHPASTHVAQALAQSKITCSRRNDFAWLVSCTFPMEVLGANTSVNEDPGPPLFAFQTPTTDFAIYRSGLPLSPWSTAGTNRSLRSQPSTGSSDSNSRATFSEPHRPPSPTAKRLTLFLTSGLPYCCTAGPMTALHSLVGIPKSCTSGDVVRC